MLPYKLIPLIRPIFLRQKHSPYIQYLLYSGRSPATKSRARETRTCDSNYGDHLLFSSLRCSRSTVDFLQTAKISVILYEASRNTRQGGWGSGDCIQILYGKSLIQSVQFCHKKIDLISGKTLYLGIFTK